MDVSIWTWARLLVAILFLSASYSLSASIDAEELRDMNQSQITECYWTDGGTVCVQTYKFLSVDTGIPLALYAPTHSDKGFLDVWGMVKKGKKIRE